MKRLLILVLILLAGIPLYPQDSAGFINTLGDKETATFGDAVTLFSYVINRTPRGFQQDRAALNETGLLRNMDYDQNRSLRRGILARMIARHMHLKGSLMYLIFGTERYAYTACVAGGIMDPGGSEWDVLSGEELIEAITRMTDAMEGSR
ncbi:MAG: hypothetical protein JXA20_10480 [Spirochaetes bacterium]|nr:hypothetical protein [Spirochaetota bacterium]